MTVKEIYEKAEWKLDHNEITIGEFEKLVDIEVVEQKQGEWIETDEGHICSECGLIALKERCEAMNNHMWYEDMLTPYCPNCGARMNKQTCETCEHYNPEIEAIACERCLDGKYSQWKRNTQTDITLRMMDI